MARSQELSRLFQQPDSPAQRRYEICRAYFHEATPADDIAQRFQLHVDTVRAIVRDFARDPDINSFFAPLGPVPRPPRNARRSDRACELRRQGATLADIRATLQREGFDVSESYLFRVLRRAGLTATRHRRPTPQPGESANDGSVVPDIADVRALSLEDGPAIPHQGRRPLPVPPPAAGPRSARAVATRGLARLGADPAPAGVARLAGPQAARQATHQSHQRSVL